MNFNRYTAEKENLKYNFNGYHLEKVIALDLISEVYRNSSFKLKNLAFCFLSYRLNSLNNLKPENKLFSIGNYPRKDYYEILKYVNSQISNVVLFDFNKTRFKVSFRIKNILLAFKHIFKNSSLPFKSKLFLSCQLCFYLNIISELEKVNPTFIKYCAFSSVHQLEAIFTCFFKKKKITTYSLQHGIYYIFEKNIPIDVIAYENFISDKHLCWGQYSKDEFMKYGINEDSLIVCGYPRNYDMKIMPKVLDSTNCVVLLARHSLKASNIKLLKILKRFSTENNIKVSLKLHPSLKHQEYQEICNSYNWNLIDKNLTISELFSKGNYGFAIAVNTAAYYEAYINYVPCLRYNDIHFEDAVAVNNADTFTSLNELILAYKSIPFSHKFDLDTYFKDSNAKLQYILGLGINNYSILNG